MTPQDRRESIAALAGNLGYQALLADLEESTSDILASLAGAKEEEQVLRFARLWQVFFHYWTLLKTTPDKLRDELNQEINQAGLHDRLDAYHNTVSF